MTKDNTLSAGDFSSWLTHMREALVANIGVDVACGECNACCKSSYFIHIRPDETQALSAIPKKLIFPAPGLPKGNMLMGYDEEGHCPMLIDNRCSIYDYRPLTCRTYDCRMFAAVDIPVGKENKALITEHVARWKFSYPQSIDRDQHTAVKAAAAFIRGHADCFPDGYLPRNVTQRAVLAVKVSDLFLRDPVSQTSSADVLSDKELAAAIVSADKEFMNPK